MDESKFKAHLIACRRLVSETRKLAETARYGQRRMLDLARAAEDALNAFERERRKTHLDGQQPTLL